MPEHNGQPLYYCVVHSVMATCHWSPNIFNVNATLVYCQIASKDGVNIQLNIGPASDCYRVSDYDTFERIVTRPNLWVQAFLHQTFQVYHVYYNFIQCSICRITVNFRILKDESLLIKVASNKFSDRNIFQNGVDALSKINDIFLTKRWRFHLVHIIRLCSNFAGLWHKQILWNYKWNFRLPIFIANSVTLKYYL